MDHGRAVTLNGLETLQCALFTGKRDLRVIKVPAAVIKSGNLPLYHGKFTTHQTGTNGSRGAPPRVAEGSEGGPKRQSGGEFYGWFRVHETRRGIICRS